MVKILIMDDEPGLRNIVFNILKPLGHTLFTAEDGNQALEIARREIPDLAMLDMRVPDMDGLEVLAELRKINPNIRAVMLSGFGDVETAVNALKQGAFDYISKPFKVDEVLKVVDKAIQLVPQGAAPAASPASSGKAPAPAQPAKTAVAGSSAARKAVPAGALIGGAVLVLALAGFIAMKSFFGAPAIEEYSLPYSNPIGMSWVKPNLWISDWVIGNIYQHNVDPALSIASMYKTNNTQPTGIAFDGEAVWTCSSVEKRIYKHRRDSALSIEAIYATPDNSPSGLCFDGAHLWVIDTVAARLYKHKMDETLSVVRVYDSPAVNPCGMFRNSDSFYIGDYKTSRIYKVSVNDLSVSEIYSVAPFADGKYKMANITWDGQNVWASADGTGKVFRFPLDALKPVKF